MKLDRPFYKLSIRFDVARLRAEVAALPHSAWVNHPNDIAGNRTVRLISADGGPNDATDGVMLPTEHLLGSPYLSQVLASFGVVWSRSRLLKLDPFAGVPPHADINYHWFNRVRVHIPVITHPAVQFFCGDEVVHMADGEAWIFDNWRLHHVENPVGSERVHLVADTSGSAAFWRFVGQSAISSTKAQSHTYMPSRRATVLTERSELRSVMCPAEVDLLVTDLQGELMEEPNANAHGRLIQYSELLTSFRQDWRQLYQLFGENEIGFGEYGKLRDSLRLSSRNLGPGLLMRTNRIAAHSVLEGRLLRVLLPERASRSLQRVNRRQMQVERPIFIVSAPRAGSTLLFETLATSEEIWTLGGEAHWLVESIPELRPGAPDVQSNRLVATQCTQDIANLIIAQILGNLKDANGRARAPTDGWRFLEKTPKNALRIPFFSQMFPDALFIFLWRDPRENISSIMEAWRSGNWKTYNGLEGIDGPWSLLLPPGWEMMRGKSLEDVAAFQWDVTNQIVLDDLRTLPKDRFISVSYSKLTADPAATIRKLCDFVGIGLRGALAERIASHLPLSRFTQTEPAVDKWLKNEAAISRVIPQVQQTWRRLQSDLPGD